MSEVIKSEVAQQGLQALMRVWFDFERQLGRIPLLQRLQRGQFSLDDYQTLLLHWRQQVIEGSRWISRCASSFDRNYSDVRSAIIGHARDEHRDYEMLEQDFVAAGGKLATIHAASRADNIGSEALHGFIMYRASQPNPVDLVGAMWIIEGLGQKMASSWAGQIEQATGCDSNCTRFMRYHGSQDEHHMQELYQLLDRVCSTPEQLAAIVRTAKVVARLYCLQLEEVEHGQ
ncbi:MULTISPECIES: iron-containing redox enzyme family protein [Alkalimonas]|uniref:Iron-containing redox enzyme family protein n=1 Tax=Alkalimonas mucilaginosa TaxID=3057676 RepID=A0ABU7JE33_9GAMM|nr:iron-containing redox enzyme family protein [Alkalimonas sp. MEB004]MEE2023957.1 iron-containing redox enzyme family protein [Alkalimonas sp. MEB004]